MNIKKTEIHLDVYSNRSELYTSGNRKPSIFIEGKQSPNAAARAKHIMQEFANGFFANAIHNASDVLAQHPLTEAQATLVKDLVGGISSEFGRALVGLACLQLAIKSIEPMQSIRLHKGGQRTEGFSWQEGISMRSLDSKYNTPFLREYGLLNINRDGIMMTRTLAENYPYSRVYKAEIRGPLVQWIELVELVEDGSLPSFPALCLLLSILKNRSDAFASKAEQASQLALAHRAGFADVTTLLTRFFTDTSYSARAFEVVIHSFMQALDAMHLIDGRLIPLSQMRSANKKHGNIGDIELADGNAIIEAWDAKYGKPYLRDELEELNDKLVLHQEVESVGFIVNTTPDRSSDLTTRAEEIALLHECDVHLLSLSEWLERKTTGLTPATLQKLGHNWLIAVVESFSQKRTTIAPIDEPCDKWLDDLISLLLTKTI